MRRNNSKRSTQEFFKLHASSVRSRLFFFVLILLIPTAIWLGLTINQRRAFLFDQAEVRVNNFSVVAAENYARQLESGEGTLTSLAALYADDPTSACASLPALATADYTNFTIVDASGAVVCGGENAPVYDAAWLNALADDTSQTFLNERNFTLGYASGAHLFLAVGSLDWLGMWYGSVPLPEGALVSVLAQNGVIVAQYPPDENAIGQPFHDGGMFLQLTEGLAQDGTTSTSGRSTTGVTSFYGQSTFGDALYLMVEVPQSYIFGIVEAVFVQTLVSIGVLVVVIIALAWFGANWMFIRPVHKLIDATERLANGDLAARTDLPHSIVELDRLAYTINQLAVSLEQRDEEVADSTSQLKAEIQKHKETLATLEKTIHLLRTENLARLEMQKVDERKLQFLGIIAHELRTPLTSIKGFARTLLATDVEWDPENQREFIGVIDDEADQLINLVEQLLDVSQIESGRLSTHRVPTCFDNILRMAQPRLEVVTVRHTLKMNVPKKLPEIYADPHRITQVIVNLVSNAAKYSPENTTITVNMKLVDDEKIQVDVTDEGMGISAKNRRTLFQPFQRVYDEKKRVQGAGLGLVICKGIIEAHGGQIWIEDRDGPGTTFSFTVPLVPHHDDIITTMQ